MSIDRYSLALERPATKTEPELFMLRLFDSKHPLEMGHVHVLTEEQVRRHLRFLGESEEQIDRIVESTRQRKRKWGLMGALRSTSERR